MKCLITGASGLVGTSTKEVFKEKDWTVIGIDNNARSRNLGTPQKVGDIELDFTNAKDVFNLFENHKFDAVIHAGAQPSHDWSNDHVLEDFLTNAFGTVLLLEATRKHCPEATFVYVSTDKVYGERMTAVLRENPTRLTPRGNEGFWADGFDESLGLDFAGHRSPFGCSKASGDMYAQEYANTFDMNVGIFRPGCITGKNHEGAELHGFLAYLAQCIKTGKPYRIFGFKGKQVRDQIHAYDLATAFYAYVEKPVKGVVYNMGGGQERSVSVLEAIKLIEDKTGKKAITEFAEARPGDRAFDVHDVSKFRNDYPEWNYTYSLDDIISDVCSK